MTSSSRFAPRRWLLALGFGLAALIHLAPLPGLLSSTVLQRLYGLDIVEPDLLLLMRHRALLFGLLGAGLLLAIRLTSWRRPMWLAGVISAGGFLLLALGGTYNAALQRVIVGDIVAVLALVAIAPWVWRRGADLAT
jgi:hypothetical protein